MHRRTLLQTSLAFTAATFFIAAHAQSTGVAATKRQKLVIQVSDADPAKWSLALNNAQNVQEELGAANVEIELVAYGPGIGMLKIDSAANSRVAEALKAGVKIVACENTMRKQKLSKEDMLANISYAPAGVTEIMRLQQAGWSYIRP